ncbi:AmmeMemoRadiSam system protein A [bacterium]|nr:AmmeMemoRadiSam system protein A [bacterium]
MSHPAPSIAFSGLMPHPPIIVPGVGGPRQQDARHTMEAMAALSKRLLAAAPDSLVLISPHSPRKRGMFGIWAGKTLRGSLAQFGTPQSAVELPNDEHFIARLINRADDFGVRTWRIPEDELDHGAMVPLYYIAEAGWDGPTTILSLNYPGENQLEDVGKAIAAVAEEMGRRLAVMASGDMSHRLKPNAPGGYHPDAQQFDDRFVKLVRQGDFYGVRDFDVELQDLAGEDVVDSSVIAMAAIGYDAKAREVLSYEGPFGVGYCVAAFREPSVDPEKETTDADSKQSGQILPTVARRTVEAYLKRRERYHPEIEIGGYLASRAGVFVTIHTMDGDLRGCIGSLVGEQENVVLETVERAISAAVHDHRFPPVEVGELPNLHFEVSVLHPPEVVQGTAALDPERFGVIIRDGHGRRAVMLPGIESLDTVEKQVSATRRKAGIPPGESVQIERFEVDKFEEERPA